MFNCNFAIDGTFSIRGNSGCFSQIKSLPFNITREQANRILIEKTSIFEKHINKKGLTGIKI
jgi:hypothetical protein